MFDWPKIEAGTRVTMRLTIPEQDGQIRPQRKRRPTAQTKRPKRPADTIPLVTPMILHLTGYSQSPP